MKNKISFWGTLVAVIGFSFSFSGCGSTPVQVTTVMNYENWGAFGEATAIPVKDFEVRGLVYKTFVFTVDDKGKIEGDVFSYQALLKEAEKAGADAVINVTIDKRIDNVKSSGKSLKTNKQETWYVSALAIKYTDPITAGENLAVNKTRIWTLEGGASTSVER
jgi:hypothetical protein